MASSRLGLGSLTDTSSPLGSSDHVLGYEHELLQLPSTEVCHIIDESVKLNLIDVSDEESCTDSRRMVVFQNARALKSYFDLTSETYRVRLMYGYASEACKRRTKLLLSSIHQRNSWARLEICPSILGVIMRKHDIMPEFLHVVRCFQNRSLSVEEAFGASSWTRCLPSSKGTCYGENSNNGLNRTQAHLSCRNRLRPQIPRKQWPD